MKKFICELTIIVGLWLLVACSPTSSATERFLPNSDVSSIRISTLTPAPAPSFAPTAVATMPPRSTRSAATNWPVESTVTLLPPKTIVPTVTPVQPSLSIRSPLNAASLIEGGGVDIVGTVTGTSVGQVLLVQLFQDGIAYTDERLLVQDGDWRVLTALPDNISGEMKIVATLIDPLGEIADQALFAINVMERMAAE